MKGARLVIFLTLAAGIISSWYFLNRHFQKTHPEWYEDPKPEQVANQNDSSQPGTQPTTQAVPATQPGTVYAIGGNGKPTELGSTAFDPKGKKSDYAIGLAIDPQ